MCKIDIWNENKNTRKLSYKQPISSQKTLATEQMLHIFKKCKQIDSIYQQTYVVKSTQLGEIALMFHVHVKSIIIIR